MRVFQGIDDVESAVGEHLGHSDWLEITQERVNVFADATGDHQWIHVDPERAAQGPFAPPSPTATSRCHCCRSSARNSCASTA